MSAKGYASFDINLQVFSSRMPLFFSHCYHAQFSKGVTQIFHEREMIRWRVCMVDPHEVSLINFTKCSSGSSFKTRKKMQ